MARLSMTGFMIATLLAAFAPLTPIAAQAADEVLVESTFTGKSGHNTFGGVSIVKSGSSMKVVLGPDFRFDGAPDPNVGFGNGGNYDSEAQLSDLKSNSGKQDYKIPESIEPESYSELYIWCVRFNVPLGVAVLSWPEEDAEEAATD